MVISVVNILLICVRWVVDHNMIIKTKTRDGHSWGQSENRGSVVAMGRKSLILIVSKSSLCVAHDIWMFRVLRLRNQLDN